MDNLAKLGTFMWLAISGVTLFTQGSTEAFWAAFIVSQVYTAAWINEK